MPLGENMEKEVLEILKQLFVGASYTVFAVGVALIYTWPSASIKAVGATYITSVVLFIFAVISAQIKSRV